MKPIDIDSLKPSGGAIAIFNGFEQGISVLFFIVHIFPGHGPKKHRHPYEKIFILLDREIEAVVDEQPQMIGKDKIAIISAGTWHEFRVCSENPVSMINIHPVPKKITEWDPA